MDLEVSQIYSPIRILCVICRNFSVGSDRAGSGEGRQSVAENQKADVLLPTNVGRPQSSGFATQSNGKQSYRTRRADAFLYIRKIVYKNKLSSTPVMLLNGQGNIYA